MLRKEERKERTVLCVGEKSDEKGGKWSTRRERAVRETEDGKKRAKSKDGLCEGN